MNKLMFAVVAILAVSANGAFIEPHSHINIPLDPSNPMQVTNHVIGGFNIPITTRLLVGEEVPDVVGDVLDEPTNKVEARRIDVSKNLLAFSTSITMLPFESIITTFDYAFVGQVNFRISRVNVIVDQGATWRVTNGGIGFNYVSMQIVSEVGRGYHAVINIYSLEL